jgi:hypothetical protein
MDCWEPDSGSRYNPLSRRRRSTQEADLPQNRGHRRSLGRSLQIARPSTEGSEASDGTFDFLEQSCFRTGNARTCKSSGIAADPPALAQCRHRRSTYKDGECSRRGGNPFICGLPQSASTGMLDANCGESRSGPVLRMRLNRQCSVGGSIHVPASIGQQPTNR